MPTSALAPPPLDIAVVGFGVMGRHHANIYSSLPYVNLLAIVEPDTAAQQLARQRHAVPCFASLEHLLASQQPLDALSIVTPTWTHYALSKMALEAGLHILVEKPVTATVSQAEALITLSRQCQRIVQVGHITRFYRAIQLLSEKIHTPYLIEARRLSPNARIQDVGVILDLMIHDIDIVLGLVPHAIREYTVAGHYLHGNANGKHEDVAAAQIIFENGCIARFLASRIAPDAERSLVVAEAEQTLRLDFSRDPHAELAIYRQQKPANPRSNEQQVQVSRTFVEDDNPLRKEIEHFIARIRYDATPIGTLEDDLRSLKLAHQLQYALAQKQQACVF